MRRGGRSRRSVRRGGTRKGGSRKTRVRRGYTMARGGYRL